MYLDLWKSFFTYALEVYVVAFNNTFSLSIKQPLKFSLLRCAFHRVLKHINQHKLEFTCILLHVSLFSVPAECAEQLKCSDCFVVIGFSLQIEEDALEAERDCFGVWNVVDCWSDVAYCEECLNQTVHIASGAFIYKPQKVRLFLR